MLPLMMVVVLAATPAPKPTPPLKVIINVHSTSFCSSVRTMAVPIGYVTRRNDEAFAAIDHSMVKFFESIAGISSAGNADWETLNSELDDAAIYTPMGALSTMKINQIAYQIMHNLSLEDHVMHESWIKYPQGAYPTIDAMRERLQNLMDLQRALASKYVQFASIYTDNAGQAKYADDAATFKSLLRDTILGYASALEEAKNGSDPGVPPQQTVHDLAHSGSVAGVVKELRLQEMAFTSEIVDAGNSCGI